MENIILTNVSIEDLAKLVAEKVLSLQNRNNIQEEIQDPDEFLTMKQACEFLKLAKPTLYAFTCKRTIPYFKKGKFIFFKRVDLIDWMNSGRKKTVEEIRGDSDSIMLRNKRNKNV
jgi:excisionase family DNA binding protein